MDRLRALLKGREEPEYERLEDETTIEEENSQELIRKPSFSYTAYAIFLLLGVSMLWAWNMFLAAGPYFQHRFQDNEWIFNNFQSAEISVSTVINLVSMLTLTRLQAGASYPKRIISSLVINMITFALLALFTEAFLGISAKAYFGFLIVTISFSSLAAALCQNGIFAYVTGFGEPRYTQGIMTGQAVAGVLPCIAQIVTVLSVHGSAHSPPHGGPHIPPHSGGPPSRGPPPVHPSSAFAYFITATAISVSTLLAFLYLLTRERVPVQLQDHGTEDVSDVPEEHKQIPLHILCRKLFWLASAVFLTFGITMVFPVFTQRITSVRPPQAQPPLFQPPSFVPLAFLFWNSGDLFGRLLTAVPSLSLTHRPRIVFILSVSRVVFIGLYYLCNIRGQGAIVKSDFFYLVVVQLLFGLTNGYLGSTCMIGAGEWVEPEEREAAGGFMVLCLVAGLTVGSLASFFAAGG